MANISNYISGGTSTGGGGGSAGGGVGINQYAAFFLNPPLGMPYFGGNLQALAIATITSATSTTITVDANVGNTGLGARYVYLGVDDQRYIATHSSGALTIGTSEDLSAFVGEQVFSLGIGGTTAYEEYFPIAGTQGADAQFQYNLISGIYQPEGEDGPTYIRTGSRAVQGEDYPNATLTGAGLVGDQYVRGVNDSGLSGTPAPIFTTFIRIN